MARRQPMLHELQGHDFPDYEFKEFPKWVTDSAGKRLIVHSAEEEAKVTSGGDEPDETPKDKTAPLPSPKTERISSV